jgi:hypothetical protein
VSGAVALAAAKGGRVHRRSGTLFVYAMVTMALGGAAIAMNQGRGAVDQCSGGADDDLWRMCLALFIATGSFFLGQAQVFPAPIRDSGLLAVPVFAVLAAMLYWLWRVRARHTRAVAAPALTRSRR